MEHREMIYTDNNFQGQRQKSRHKSLSQNALMHNGSSATDKLAKRIICHAHKNTYVNSHKWVYGLAVRLHINECTD